MQSARLSPSKGYVSGIEAPVEERKHLAWWAGWIACGGLLAVIALRLVWHDGLWPLLIFNAYAWLLFAPAWVIAPLALWRKKRRMALAATICVCWHLVHVVPPIVAAEPPPPANERRLRVVNANLLTSNRHPDTLLDELLAFDADVLILQEVSPVWVHVMEARGVLADYPHRLIEPRGDAFGAAILSRVEAIEANIREVDGLPWPRMVIPFGAGTIELLCVHTLPPRTSAYVEGHLRQLDALADWSLRDARTRIVSGDFNSTVWSRFHARMDESFDDAWNIAGDGFGFTWPNGLFDLPPARLDHVYLSRDLTVTSMRVGRGAGSDHRPLFLEIAER